MQLGKTPITILIIMKLPTPLKVLFQKKAGEPVGMPAVYKLLEALVNAGHNVHFASIVDPAREEIADLEDRNRHLVISGVHFHVLRVPYGRFSSLLLRARKPFSRLFSYCRGTFKAVFCLWQLSRLTSRIKPDVIYAGMNYQFVGGLIGRFKQVPTIIRFYGTFLSHNSLGDRWAFLKNPQVVLGFKLPCDCFIVTNDGTRGDEVAKFYRVSERKLKFWINGVDKTMYQPDFDRADFLSKLGVPPSKKIVLTLCRLISFHQIDSLIHTVPQVVEKVNDVVFLIVGDGPGRPNLELLAQRLEVNSHVRFLGSVSREEVANFLNAADLFVSLYDFSNLCNPVLEAMSCGKCIVSLDDGSLESIIENGKDGILVKPELVDAELPNILADLLRDDSRRQQLGRNAREFAMNNLETWEERIAKEIRLIEEVASNRPCAE